MSQPSTNIVDAVSGEEVCPLCFDLYSGADACTCSVCQVSSCPSCAELIDLDPHSTVRALNPEGAVRCFACRPVESATGEAVLVDAPLSLPRPIVMPNAAREHAVVGLPSLPFPLTTSPHGVRVLSPRPPGTVFIGLPPPAPVLSQTLRAPGSEARAPQLALSALAGRARQKLLLLARLVALGALLAVRVKPLFARLAEEARRLRPRLVALRVQAAARLAQEARRARPQLLALRGQVSALLARARTELVALARRARPRLDALAAQLSLSAARLYGRVARAPLFARIAPRAKPPVVRADPSRPISL